MLCKAGGAMLTCSRGWRTCMMSEFSEVRNCPGLT